MSWMTPFGGILVAALELVRVNQPVPTAVCTVVLIVALVLFVLDFVRPFERLLPPR